MRAFALLPGNYITILGDGLFDAIFIVFVKLEVVRAMKLEITILLLIVVSLSEKGDEMILLYREQQHRLHTHPQSR